MASTPERPIAMNHALRNWGLAITSWCLIIAACANINAASNIGHCNGLCGCVAPLPPTNPQLPLGSCPTWEQLLPILRLIEALPVLSAMLFVGSLILAIAGLSLERRTRRTLQAQHEQGEAASSHWRGVFIANVAQVLQLLPLVVVTVIGWVALFTFLAP